jgi:hypothetical protein
MHFLLLNIEAMMLFWDPSFIFEEGAFFGKKKHLVLFASYL